MMPVFKKIRKKFAEDNKPIKYLRYAIGEIVLVVIGILIALQVNNWNEKRKKTLKYKAILEQIYTVLDQDVQEMESILTRLNEKTTLIENLLNHPSKMDMALLPSLLYYVDAFPETFKSEANYQMNFLEFDQDNIVQNSLSKSIASYNSDQLDFNAIGIKHLIPILKHNDLPEPTLIFGYSSINNFENLDRHFYSTEQQKTALKLLEDISIKNALKSARSQNNICIILAQNKKNDALTTLTLIKKFYPEVKLLYQNIGIVGDATQNKNYNENVPMILTNPKLSIWELTVELHEGTMKFRDGNSWLANWGGSSYPNGKAKWFGENIPVKSGKYHITLNLTEKSYQFELLSP